MKGISMQLEEDEMKSATHPIGRSNEASGTRNDIGGDLSEVSKIHAHCCNLCPNCRGPFVAGEPNLLGPDRLSEPDIVHYATEAVKEYNKRYYKDKIELVKVKRALVYFASGFRYDLTFNAKIVADGGERTRTCRADVWIKLDGTKEVLNVNLVPDTQGALLSPTAETEKVIHDHYKDSENNERDKKKTTQLGEGEMKSATHPIGTSNETSGAFCISTGIIERYVSMGILPLTGSCPPGSRLPGSRPPFDSCRKNDAPDGPLVFSNTWHPPRFSFVPGESRRLDPTLLSDPEVVLCAEKAVDEYNKREDKDKIKLVKVLKGRRCYVNGLRYDLSFEAKVVDNGGERTQTYSTDVWIKSGIVQKVNSVYRIPDDQGKEEWWEKHMY